MERVEAELFTDGGNDAVVRLPGRKFPGVLMQGDSLHILRSDLAEVVDACARGDLAEVVDACARGDLAEARDSAGLLLVGLDALLTRYEDTLQQHEIPRP
ncbi:DUF6959 family protein [Streptomyces longwoodensis]|uniref:DUF6959 family protein n=1 Tax=Streptomyces longwoodensis TaxID=68231 RepID=UPI0030E32221